MRQTRIYVGLNDAETHEQKFGTEKYLSVLKNVCRAYHVAFSVNEMNGGYFHEDGTYVEEQSLALTLIDVPRPVIREIAQDLCVFFHQESVMVTDAPAAVFFLKADLEET